MKYLVKAKLKPGRARALQQAIADKTLGRGSVAGGEYLKNMHAARIDEHGVITWVEVCFCAAPLDEECPYWEAYFDLLEITDAHPRKNCRDETGEIPRDCITCDCTDKLEARMAKEGKAFLPHLLKLCHVS